MASVLDSCQNTLSSSIRAAVGASSGYSESAESLSSLIHYAAASCLQPGSFCPVACHWRNPCHPDPGSPSPPTYERTLPSSSSLVPAAGQPGAEPAEPVALQHQPATHHALTHASRRTQRDGQRPPDSPTHAAACIAFCCTATDQWAAFTCLNPSGGPERAADATYGGHGEVRVHRCWAS